MIFYTFFHSNSFCMLQKYTQMFTSAARWLSSRSVPLITRNIEGFELCSYGGQSNGQHPRPVVVLIGWLNARRKHLRKYQELYCGRGLDVLTMPVSPIHIVRPRTGITYTKKLLKVLQVGKCKGNAQCLSVALLSLLSCATPVCHTLPLCCSHTALHHLLSAACHHVFTLASSCQYSLQDSKLRVFLTLCADI